MSSISLSSSLSNFLKQADTTIDFLQRAKTIEEGGRDPHRAAQDPVDDVDDDNGINQMNNDQWDDDGDATCSPAAVVLVVGVVAAVATAVWAYNVRENNRESYLANMEAANKVNALRTMATGVNRICNVIKMEEPNCLTGCEVQSLGVEFSGEAIKRGEDIEAQASCCDRFCTRDSSKQTAAAIKETIKSVEAVKAQAFTMYNHINPDNPREFSQVDRARPTFCAIL